jgi:3-hydroxybutyryl-CoA dehydrogenase
MIHIDASHMKRAAVLGAGTMGHGIAHVLALAGIETRLQDVSEEAVAKGLAAVRANLEKGVQKGKLAQGERDAAVARLSGTSRFEQAIEGVELVIEAVPERLELKQHLFESLGRRLGPGVLLATNTSSLSITRIANVTQHAERVVGMHFFNPVHLMKLVEVVETPKSSDEAVQAAMNLGLRLGKEPIRVQDAPGFASSRLGIAIGLEAIRMVEAGVASAQDIDKAMKLGYGFPMGPLELTDVVGLDVRLSIAEYLERELGERFAPPQLLIEMVERGELGKKSGKGFYEWPT